MTIRNLEKMFAPKSIAVIGASPKPDSLGHLVIRNIMGAGFVGDLFAVNPNHEVIGSLPVYPDIRTLPTVPDLAVLLTHRDTVPKLIGELGEKGTRAAAIITAGFGEGDDPVGKRILADTLAAAKPHTLRIIGPNCLGVMAPGAFLNASFAHIQPLPGRLAFVAQSGAMITAVLDWATHRRIGFSHFVSLGDMADVDFGDMLDYLANDGRTRAVLLYIEAVTHARKFMSAARAAARMKPVIALKAGRHAEAARAAESHTGALAGSDAAYDAAFRRAGILRVSDMPALFDAVRTLSVTQSVAGERLIILSNGGGAGVMATDTLMDKGGTLAVLSPETIARLDAVLPAAWSRGNPVDIIGDADAARYRAALAILLDAPDVDAILVIHCPSAVTAAIDIARAVIDIHREKSKGYSRKPMLLACWPGEGTTGARQIFGEHEIPSYETPDHAVRGFMQLVRYQEGQRLLMETPPTISKRFAPDTAGARKLVSAVMEQNRQWLTEPEAKGVLASYAIPVVETRTAATPDEAAAIAERLGGPVVLKIHSEDMLHKSDADGVSLNLETPAQVRESAAAMLNRIGKSRPDARIRGVTVQPMIHRESAVELLVGMTEEPPFGPVLLFGHGGTAAEVIRDMAMALPPLNMHLAMALMARTRVFNLLKGYRNRPSANLAAVAFTLVKLSQLICDLPEIREIDINPLLADDRGVMALDARIRVAPADARARDRLAICPYPAEMEEALTLPDGQKLWLRPIKPEDEPAFHELFASLSMEEIRMRFLHSMKIMSHAMAARLTQIDYDRQMAMVLTDPPETEGVAVMYGVVRISADPDNRQAEFAIMLRNTMTGMGLGPMLLRRIFEYARGRGIQEIYGDVLAENKPMLSLCRAFGFTIRADLDDPGVMRVTLDLRK